MSEVVQGDLLDNGGGTLTLKQERFCQLYATEVEFFGNGVQSYIEAYSIDVHKPGKYESAKAASQRLLKRPDILKRIDHYLEDLHLNNQHVDKQMAFWITQKANPIASIAAIKEYNALKKRVSQRIEVTDLSETRKKIGGFLDDISRHDPSSEPPAPDSSLDRGEISETPTDIS